MYQIFNILDRPIVLDKKATAYCETTGKLFSVKDYCELIPRHFKNVKDIGVTLRSDPEITDYEKVVFEAVVDDDDLDGILRREAEFYIEAYSQIPLEILKEFVLTVRIHHAKTKITMGGHA